MVFNPRKMAVSTRALTTLNVPVGYSRVRDESEKLEFKFTMVRKPDQTSPVPESPAKASQSIVEAKAWNYI